MKQQFWSMGYTAVNITTKFNWANIKHAQKPLTEINNNNRVWGFLIWSKQKDRENDGGREVNLHEITMKKQPAVNKANVIITARWNIFKTKSMEMKIATKFGWKPNEPGNKVVAYNFHFAYIFCTNVRSRNCMRATQRESAYRICIGDKDGAILTSKPSMADVDASIAIHSKNARCFFVTVVIFFSFSAICKLRSTQIVLCGEFAYEVCMRLGKQFQEHVNKHDFHQQQTAFVWWVSCVESSRVCMYGNVYEKETYIVFYLQFCNKDATSRTKYVYG